MRIRNHDDENFELPLVPMIDMMLVLLIFFMVATTLKDTRPELPVTLPDSSASVDVKIEPKVVVIGIDSAGGKFLDGNPTTSEQLTQRLAAVAKDPSQPVQLDIDRDAHYNQIVEVLDLCQFEGLKNISFHTRKLDGNH
jgi:biopolymer transport protein ExbD